MSNLFNHMMQNLRVVSLKPSDTQGVITVKFATTLTVELNVPEDTVAKMDDPQVAETVRAAAADRASLEMFGPTATEIINMRDSAAKKYRNSFNKLLENLIGGGRNG